MDTEQKKDVESKASPSLPKISQKLPKNLPKNYPKTTQKQSLKNPKRSRTVKKTTQSKGIDRTRVLRTTTPQSTRTAHPSLRDDRATGRRLLTLNHAPIYSVSTEFWKSLQDEEFFGPRLKHVYFYGRVNEVSVTTLRSEIISSLGRTRAEGTTGAWIEPKPIIIHIHSRGGELTAGKWLASVYPQVSVPICAMVDGFAASAATLLSVSAPYRVAASPFSLTLIHDYKGGNYEKRESLLSRIKWLEHFRQRMKSMYRTHLTIDEKSLEEILTRDLWWDVNTALKFGVYDRVLFHESTNTQSKNSKKVVTPDIENDLSELAFNLKLSPSHPLHSKTARRSVSSNTTNKEFRDSYLFKTNWNHVSVTCDSQCPRRLDELLCQNSGADLKPIVLISPYLDIEKNENENNKDDNKMPVYVCTDPYISYAVIPRLLACRQVPIIGIIDNDLDWWKFIPIFFCTYRYMYNSACITSYLLYHTPKGYKFKDMIHNTLLKQRMLRAALTSKVDGKSLLSSTATPHGFGVLDSYLEDLFDKSQMISAEQCYDMGIIDEIVVDIQLGALDIGKPNVSLVM